MIICCIGNFSIYSTKNYYGFIVQKAYLNNKKVFAFSLIVDTKVQGSILDSHWCQWVCLRPSCKKMLLIYTLGLFATSALGRVGENMQ